MTNAPRPPCARCWWHDVAEPADGAHRVCGECGHVYPTAADLVEAYRREVGAPPPGAAPFCPLCAHDW